MTHPPRFLQEILAHPEDDSPRLRYANWLDACGNPLGEFIRLQCEIARSTPHGQHLQHERRSQDLLARFRREWEQPLVDRVEWCSFRRGFIEEVSLTDRQLIRHGMALFQRAPVFDLHLMSDGRRLHDLPELPHVRHTLFLDLSSQGLEDDSIQRLCEAPMLQQVRGLNLGSNFIGDDGLDALTDADHLGSLRELYLNDNPISDDGLRRLVLSPIIENLDFLDVRFTHVGSDGIEALQRILGARVLVSTCNSAHAR